MPMAAFMVDPRFGLPRVLDFIADWTEVVAAHPRAIIVSYEALRQDPLTRFTALARFIDPGFTDLEIAAAVAFGGFETMQERERNGFFASERLRPGRSGATDSYKVRRGKIGGYRDYLTPIEVARVDRIVADHQRRRPPQATEPPPSRPLVDPRPRAGDASESTAEAGAA
jgi:hypothetical protein